MERVFQLKHLTVKGFRALREVDIALGPLNVVIGPNGVGKSSLLDVFDLLTGPLGRRETLSRSLTRRGGLSRILTLDKAEKLELAFDADVVAKDKSKHGARRVRYFIEVAPAGLGHTVTDETLADVDGQLPLLIHRDGAHARVLDGHLTSPVVPEPSVPETELILAEIPRTLSLAETFRGALGSIAYHEPVAVGTTSPLRTPQTLEPTAFRVAPGGSNLYSVLYQLRHQETAWYERIVDVLRAAWPGFERLEFPAVAGGQITLAWYDSAYPDRPFYANELSSGTLRFLYLVTCLLSPNLPPLLLIDEPEESLHPELLRLLAELLLEAADRTQLLVATQSSLLLRWLKPEHIIVADAEAGACRLRRGEDMNLAAWLADYSLDQLWLMGQLGGRP